MQVKKVTFQTNGHVYSLENESKILVFKDASNQIIDKWDENEEPYSVAGGIFKYSHEYKGCFGDLGELVILVNLLVD